MAKKPAVLNTHANAPGRGRVVSNELRAQFLEHYLRLGAVGTAANLVQLPRTTCQTFADEAEKDPVFVSARRSLLTSGLERVETMLLRSTELAAERIEKGPQIDASGCIVDTGPAYYRGITDAHRSLVARRKIETDVTRDTTPMEQVEVVIRMATAPDAPKTDSGAE